MSKPLLEEEKKRSVMIRLPLPMHQAYEEQARQQRRSLSNLILLLLEDCLEGRVKPVVPCPTCHAQAAVSGVPLPLGEASCADVALTR